MDFEFSKNAIEFSKDLTVIVSAAVAALVFLKTITNFTSNLVNSVTRFFKKIGQEPLILKPTLEELAKYSIKSPVSNWGDNYDYKGVIPPPRSYLTQRSQALSQLHANQRIVLIMLVMGIAFIIIIFRLITIVTFS